MRLSTRGRYAVIAMSDLAQQARRHASQSRKSEEKTLQRFHPTPLSAIARRQQISLNYLEQLFVQLRRAGLVSAMPGRQGGYYLKRNPDHIFIADIILSVDEPIKMTKCVPGQELGCTGKRARCQAHKLWVGLGQQIMAYLNKVRLSDIASGNIPSELQ